MATSVIHSFVQPDLDTLANDLADLTTLEPEEINPEDDQPASSSELLEIADPDTNLRPVMKIVYDENTPIDPTHYAAGISDADGCFHVVKKGQNIGVQFTITQSLKGIDALHYLYQNLGGSVILHIEGDEKNQRAYTWVLNGQDALDYARLLSQYLLLKKREAIRFIEFPVQSLRIIPIIAKNLNTGEELKFDTLKECKEHFGANLAFKKRDVFVWQDWEIRKSLSDAELQELKDKRQAIFEDLRDFKEMPHDEIPLDVKPSDAYFGGFADGEITFDTSKRFVQHHNIKQASPPICELYKRNFGGKVTQTKTGIYRWDIHTGADDFLKRIAPYVYGKKKQVDLIMNMKPGEGEMVHAMLRPMKGKGNPKTPKIDRYHAGTGIQYTVKDLPRGVFRKKLGDPLRVQLQYKKKVYVLGILEENEVAEASALFLRVKRYITECEANDVEVDLSQYRVSQTRK